MNNFFKAVLFIISVFVFMGGLSLLSDDAVTGGILLGASIGSIVFGSVCQRMCYEKGRDEDGFYVGYFLGIIGLIIVATMKDKSENSKEKNSDKYDELKKLQDLKNAGTLTDEEFKKEKEKLLQ